MKFFYSIIQLDTYEGEADSVEVGIGAIMADFREQAEESGRPVGPIWLMVSRDPPDDKDLARKIESAVPKLVRITQEKKRPDIPDGM